MKAKKILCSIIAGTMVLSAMSFTAFAAPEPETTPEDTTEETNVTDAEITQEIKVIFKETEELNVYEIALAASDGTIINRLNSLDFTFANNPTKSTDDPTPANITYEIEAAADKNITVTTVNDDPDRYEFHFNGKDGVTGDTDTEIVIGTVTFNGYGKLDFKVDDTVDTNAVHATTADDNIVDSFKAGEGLVIDYESADKTNDSFIDELLEVPTQTLTIEIKFNNGITGNDINYQDMKVTISGGDITADNAADHEFDLGDQTEGAVIWSDADQTYTITDTLTKDVLYSVKVKGAGYRTTSHTFTMTDDKTLHFWNNVKDPENAMAIEEGKAEVTNNFLAGDIVDDKIINIYDLSAVVSYFGSEANVENNYAKYDLNRDGVIDSKDVAYVLVSWDK